MSALHRKLLRNIWSMKGQVLAICLVVAAGVALFVMTLSALNSLSLTKETYYERYRFAHIFAHLKRAPNSLAPRIAEIPGIAALDTRVTFDVTLDVPDLEEPAVGRLISLPKHPDSGLNRVYLRRGRFPEPLADQEVLVSEGFADAHKFEPGDRVQAIINGRRKQLKIVGVALSPEYIYQIRPGDIFPDELRFGIFWMNREPLATAFDMDGAFNDVTLLMMPGASEAEVIRRLDLLTEAYGGLGAYGRHDQVSDRFISDEIKQLGNMARIMPVIFLSVAAFLLNMVMARIISTQREQIAALKAFGYSSWAIGLHYLELVLFITLVGAVIGTALGAYLGHDLTQVYARFYRFPILTYRLPLRVIVLGSGVSCVAGVVGAVGAVRHAVRLPPAEAMRPEPPANYRPTLIERLGWTKLLTQPERMILRHLERRPIKSAPSVLGIALAAALIVLGNYVKDSLDYIIEAQFQLAQRQDVTVTFVEPSSNVARHELQHLPGVIRGEPFRAVPVRMRFKHHSRRMAITGLPPNSQLQRLLDDRLRFFHLPDDGLVLSAKLGQLLDLRVGDKVTVEVLEGERPVRQVPVVAMFSEFIGLSAYMNIASLNRLLREGPSISGEFLSVDPGRANELYAELKETPRVASVTIKKSALDAFQKTLAENMLRMTFFNVMFSTVIAFGVVYNSAQISLSERSRELATLRVIGFTRAEISWILLGELAALSAIAIPLGLTIGYVLAHLTALAFDTELYRIPAIIRPTTLLFAAVVVVTATLLSGLVVRRKLDHLDLIGVLKTRE